MEKNSVAKMICPMKQFFSYLGASLAAIAALASCNKEIDAPVEDLKGGVPFEICASTADTKTAMNDDWTSRWVENDSFNLFHAEAGATTAYISDGEFAISAVDLESNKFKGTLYSSLEDGKSYDWYAIYPYSAKISSPGKQTDGYVYIGNSVNLYQNGYDTKTHLSGDRCALYGVRKSVEAASPVSLVMKHLTSVVEINVTNSNDAPLTVSNISFSTDEDIVGPYYINFAGDNVVYTPRTGYVKEIANLTVNSDTPLAKGESASFYIPIKPHVAEKGSVITITVNGYEKTISLTEKDVTFTAGKIKKIKFKYDKEPEVYTLVQTDGAFEDGGKYVFAFKNGNDDTYYFISNGGTTNLSKSALTVRDGKITDPLVSYVFTATADASGYKLVNSNNNYINNTSKTTLNTNYNTAATWYPTFISASKTYKLSQGSTTGRYISYGTKETEAKGYENGSFKDQIATKVALTQYCGAISVFKLGYSVTLDPAILADNVTGVSARGLSAVELTCNIENPVDDWTLSATCDGAVVTEVDVIDGVVLYSVGQNLGESRDGWITLTYGSVSKKITVSQLAPVFKVSRAEVELAATAGSSSTITVTSDFNWMADASAGAGFTFDPEVCEWTDATYEAEKGKTTVTITASDANASEKGAISLGTLTFTNYVTYETLDVTVTQKTSYVTPSSGTTITCSDFIGQGTSGDGSSISFTKDGITIASDKGYGDDTHVRVYSGGKITISSESKKITKVEITCTAQNKSKYGPSNITGTGYSYSGYVGTWSGTATTVELKATAQVRFTQIVVTCE